MLRRLIVSIAAAAVTALTAACRDVVAPAPAAPAATDRDEAHTEAAYYRWVVTNIETIDLGTLKGGSYSAAFGINDAGVIVGESNSLFGTTVPVRWTAPGVVGGLGSLGGAGGSARGINAAGHITGWARTASGNFHAFEWTSGGGMSDLRSYEPEEPETNSYGRAINDFGRVVGNVDLAATYWNAPWPVFYHVFTPFSPAVAHDVNNSGWIVGGNLSMERAFVSRSGVLTYLPLLGGSSYKDVALGVNDSGMVVGQANAMPSGYPWRHAFRWSDATGIQDLGVLAGGNESSAEDVNNAGVIAGWSDAMLGTDSTRRGFIWRPLMVKVALPPIGGATNLRSQAYALNASGWVVGSSQTATGQTHATLWKVTMSYAPIVVGPISPIVYEP